MVLDNVDDASVFFDSQEHSIQRSSPKFLFEYLPESPNGSILITTRSRDAGVQFTGRQPDVIDIAPMEPLPTLTLPQKRLGHIKPYEDHDARELTKALDLMPLAISQAAAFICRVPSMSVAGYLKTLHKIEKDAADILTNKESRDPRRDKFAALSIVKTWQISFQYIRERRRTDTNLLSLMSFFDRQDIPISMLRLGCLTCSDETLKERFSDSGDPVIFAKSTDPAFPNVTGRPDSIVETLLRNDWEQHGQDQPDHDAKSYADSNFQEDVAMLHDFYLATSQSSADSCTMHGLVQLSTRNWLERHKCLDIWMNAYIGFMSITFPDPDEDCPDKSTWDKCHDLLPHILKMFGLRTKSQRWLSTWVYTSKMLTHFAMTQGLLSMTSKNAHLVHSEAQSLLAFDWLILETYQLMCFVLQTEGNCGDAVFLAQRNVQLSDKIYGQK